MYVGKLMEVFFGTMLMALKVKPNVGHSEGASGLTSIIKAALVLEKGVIPPNAHFLNPNPKSA